MFTIAFILFLLVKLTGTLRYVFGGILELTSPEAGVKRDYSLQPTLTIVIPCYNEGEAVYSTIKSLSETSYPKDKLTIVAVNDSSIDNSWEWIQKAAEEFPGVIALNNDENLGKTRSVLRGFDCTQSEMLMIVDSDTILAPDCIQELAACFASPKMGCVGAPARLRNPGTNGLTAFQVQMYYLNSRIAKRLESMFCSAGCIGGYSLMMRRSVFNEVRAAVEARNWHGVKVRDGEDRFLTHNIVLRGYSTYITMKAKCWTTVPDTFKKFYGQQLRWYRSSTRDFFWTTRTLWKHSSLNPVFFFVYFMVPMVTFVSIAKLVEELIRNPMFWLFPDYTYAYIGCAFIVAWILSKFHKDQKLANPALLFVFALWWLVNTLWLLPLAMLTLDSDGWGNRDAHIITHWDAKKASAAAKPVAKPAAQSTPDMAPVPAT
jgi:cellulose synthase/poly-beta-1,6-N-acetylglucosamine synthase-like glycosyltransferase